MALAWVANATASNATGSAVTGSLGTTAAGQLIVITINDDSAGTTTITGVTDTFSNTWVKVPVTGTGFTNNVGLNSVSVQMWYCVIATGKAGASHAVTVNWSTAGAARVTVGASYFNGFVNTPTLDQIKGATGTSTSASSGASATTTAAAEVVVGGFGHASTTSAYTLGSGYTNLATQNIANAAVAQESKIVSATAAMTATASIAASRAWVAIVVTFKDVAGTTTTTINKAQKYNLIGSAASTLSDNYNDNSLDTAKWDKTTYSADATQVLEQNTRIEITHSTGPQYNELSSKGIYDLTGSAIFAKITDVGNQTLLSHEAIFGIQFGTNNKLYFDINQNTLYGWKLVNGTQTAAFTGIAYSATNHLYLKVRESAGTIFFDASATGTGTWTNIGSVATPFSITGVQPFMQSGCYAAEASGSYTYFDDFNISPGSTTDITSSLRYAILKTYSPTKALKYTVKTGPAAITKGARYAIKKTYSTTKGLQYAVKRTATAITKATKYTVKTTPAALTKAARYTIKRTFSITKGLQYTVKRTPTAITKAVKYTVKTTPAAASKALRYAITKAAPISKAVKYTVRTTPTAASKALRYAIKRPVALTKSLKYTVVKPVAAITKAARYTVRKNIAVTKGLIYEVRRSLALSKAAKYTVKTTTALTKAARYVTLRQPAITKSMAYIVQGGGLMQRQLKYTVKTTKSLTKSMRYAILNAAAIAFSYNLKYTLRRTATAKTKLLQYTVRRNLAITKGLKYTIKRALSTTKGMQYAIRRNLPVTKAMRYTVLKTYAASKGMRYAITRPAAALSKAARYAIVARHINNLPLSYELLTHASLTKQARYTLRFTGSRILPLEYGLSSIPYRSSALPLGQQASSIYLGNGINTIAPTQKDTVLQLNSTARDVLAVEQKSNSIMIQ